MDDDTSVCPEMGMKLESERREEEAKRMDKHMYETRGLDKTAMEKKERETAEKLARREAMMAKIEKRKNEHEAKLLAKKGQLPKWIEDKNRKEANPKMVTGQELVAKIEGYCEKNTVGGALTGK